MTRKCVAGWLISLVGSGLVAVAALGFTPAAREDPARSLLAAWRGARFDGIGLGVRQQRFNDCGPAALAHSLRLLGFRAPFPDPATGIELTETGCGFDQLIREAARWGLRARAVRIEPVELPRIAPPAILYLDYGHFVVYEGWSQEGRIRVQDPGLGCVSYTPAGLRRHWEGHLLVFGGGGDRHLLRTGRLGPRGERVGQSRAK